MVTKEDNSGYPVEVSVESDPGRPLSGVAIVRQGSTKTLNTTGVTGKAKFVLHGNVGELVTLEVKCPPDFLPAKPIAAKLQRFVSNEPIRHNVSCTPLKRRAVFSVVADAAPGAFHKEKAVPLAGLKVKVFGMDQGVTDESGTAHILYDANPEELVKLSVEAPEGYAKKLTPAVLPFDVRIESRDAIYPIAATFHAPKEAPKPQVKPTGPIKVHSGPIRI